MNDTTRIDDEASPVTNDNEETSGDEVLLVLSQDFISMLNSKNNDANSNNDKPN